MAVDERRIRRFLARVRACVQDGRVVVTRKAAQEAAEELGFDRMSILAVVEALELVDFERCVASRVRPDDLVWIFVPEVESTAVWVRLIERSGIVVVSFHEA